MLLLRVRIAWREWHSATLKIVVVLLCSPVFFSKHLDYSYCRRHRRLSSCNRFARRASCVVVGQAPSHKPSRMVNVPVLTQVPQNLHVYWESVQ